MTGSVVNNYNFEYRSKEVTDPASRLSKEVVGTGYRSRNPWAIQYLTQHFGQMPLTFIIKGRNNSKTGNTLENRNVNLRNRKYNRINS